MHETAELADVVLPAASFAEKEGTFTNSERQSATGPQGHQSYREIADPDWDIVCQTWARRSMQAGWECPWMISSTYSHPSQIFAEMASLTPIISGLSAIERLG